MISLERFKVQSSNFARKMYQILVYRWHTTPKRQRLCLCTCSFVFT